MWYDVQVKLDYEVFYYDVGLEAEAAQQAFARAIELWPLARQIHLIWVRL
jgi:hypothetical protein